MKCFKLLSIYANKIYNFICRLFNALFGIIPNEADIERRFYFTNWIIFLCLFNIPNEYPMFTPHCNQSYGVFSIFRIAYAKISAIYWQTVRLKTNSWNKKLTQFRYIPHPSDGYHRHEVFARARDNLKRKALFWQVQITYVALQNCSHLPSIKNQIQYSRSSTIWNRLLYFQQNLDTVWLNVSSLFSLSRFGSPQTITVQNFLHLNQKEKTFINNNKLNYVYCWKKYVISTLQCEHFNFQCLQEHYKTFSLWRFKEMFHCIMNWRDYAIA